MVYFAGRSFAERKCNPLLIQGSTFKGSRLAKGGRLENWKGGRLERWKIGRVEGWNGGINAKRLEIIAQAFRPGFLAHGNRPERAA
jgi:hypothetical protein